jgi:hypothetical protein
MLNLARAAVVAGLAGVLGLAFTGARGDTGVKSNLEVMRTLSSGVCDELVSGMPAGLPTRDIRLAPAGKDDRYQLIGDVLVQTLGEKGYRAYLPVVPAASDSTARPDSSSVGLGSAGLVLEFDAIEFDLRYPKIYRSFLIGGKTVKRTATVSVMAKLVEPGTGFVVWTAEASRSLDDQFAHSDIDDVEASLYSFTKPPRQSRNWGKIIEPVVVGGIIVGLIYLFFSNQGSSS